jgi:hypothetical protein
MLTQEVLKKHLHYSKETGFFTWLIPTGKTLVGSVAGYKNPRGYIIITINKKLCRAHRLAWFYVYGYFPENGLDHKDRIRHHNWIKNLREVSGSCNLRNTGNYSSNKSGVKGITFNKKAQKWHARISLNSRGYHLGSFTDFTEAVAHRLTAEQCDSWENCDSSSPAFKFMQKYIKGLALR